MGRTHWHQTIPWLAATALTCLVTACQTPTPTTHTLSVSLNLNGAGSVKSSPSGIINCGAGQNVCSTAVQQDKTIVLTATPDTGYTFTGWGGDCTGSNDCTLTMNTAKNVIANFQKMAAVNHSLSVSKSGPGTVTSNEQSINCGTTCSANLSQGTVISLSATPDTEAKFDGWFGACSGTSTCTITMNQAKTVTAVFSKPQTKRFTLVVSKQGEGSVQSQPAGIDCGTTCAAEYAENTVVTLTPVAASGSTFAGWTGACTGTSNCSVTITELKTVGVTFQKTTAPSRILTVNKNGPGSISSNDQSINCGSTCAATTAQGANITLTATPDNGARFVAWSGACRGSGTCVLAMDTDKNVSATFETIPVSTFTIAPEQPVFYVAQKSVAFWKVLISGRNNFATTGDAFDSVVLDNNTILGTGTTKIQSAYRKTDSGQNEIVLELGAGSAVPVGDYSVTVRATSGTVVKETTVIVRVTTCSLGC